MFVLRSKWFILGYMLLLHAVEKTQGQVPEFTPPPPKHHGPTTQAPVGLFIVPFAQAAAGSIVDVNPNLIAAIQAGGSPFAAFAQSDTGESSFPPSTNWTLPESFNVISSFINKTSSSILKPSGVGQNDVEIQDESIKPKDPMLLFAPLLNKPNKPNLIQQLFVNAPGLNNSFAMIANLAQGKPEEKPPTTANDPLPNPVQGLIDSSQSTVTNASSAVQGVSGQWSTNVQNGFGNFLGASSNRPSNDEAVSGSTLNPIQTLIESSQASWINATGAAQVIAGQLGSNVQNGISNLFGINLNRPSNDEPAQPVAQTASSTTSASFIEATTSTTSASPTGSGFSNPFGVLFNSSQIALQNELVGSLLANLNRPGASNGAQLANGNGVQNSPTRSIII
uniref:Uncharacterized protein n=1 Tax=Anopheles atroparvus TaxID=41427 RepID=A0AAG5CRG3_ANOAO